MKNLRGNLWLLLTILFAVALVVFSLSDIVIQPWRIVPELGGDGAKNIFTYLYHSTNGTGCWFQGMNYPYGEHIVYTDGQPVLSVLLAAIGGITVEQALTVLWLLIGLSYVLSIVFLYRILIHYKMAPLAALLFAGIIGIFTPQIFRLQGHYALAYSCLIPMIFYWTIKYKERFHWRYCIYFFAIGCVASFIHPYYVAMMLVWVGSYAVGYIIFNGGSLMQKARYVLPLFMSVVLVLVVVAIVMKLTDPITDRPVSPLNTLYETCTRPKQILTSTHSPVWKLLGGAPQFSHISSGGEGYAYIGIVSAVTVALCFLVGIVRSFRKKKLDIIIGSSGFSPVWLFMAFAVLVFGMGIPFIWHMDWLIDYLSIFRQFRSLGRFSWIFYEIISVYTALVLYQLFISLKAKRKFMAAYTVLIVPMFFWAYEASGYIRYSRELSLKAMYNYDMLFSTLEQNWKSFLNEHHHVQTDFQAILMLPFYHVGTEKLWVGDPAWQMTLSAKASLQLNLPIVDVMMSRSSWSQAEKQVKIEGGPFISPPMLQDIKSDKPFLLMHFENDSLNPDQKYLLSASEYIGHFSQCNIYAFYPGRLAATDKIYADSIRAIIPFMRQQDTIVNGSRDTYINHLDGDVGVKHIFGKGGAMPVSSEMEVIGTIPVAPPDEGQLYEFSCWFLLGDQDYRSPYITLQCLDAQGNIDTYKDALTRQSVDNYGLWFRSSRFIFLHNNIKSVRLLMVNLPKPTYLAMDEIMLRPADALIISKGNDGTIMVNNHRFNTTK